LALAFHAAVAVTRSRISRRGRAGHFTSSVLYPPRLSLSSKTANISERKPERGHQQHALLTIYSIAPLPWPCCTPAFVAARYACWCAAAAVVCCCAVRCLRARDAGDGTVLSSGRGTRAKTGLTKTGSNGGGTRHCMLARVKTSSLPTPCRVKDNASREVVFRVQRVCSSSAALFVLDAFLRTSVKDNAVALAAFLTVTCPSSSACLCWPPASAASFLWSEGGRPGASKNLAATAWAGAAWRALPSGRAVRQTPSLPGSARGTPVTGAPV